MGADAAPGTTPSDMGGAAPLASTCAKATSRVTIAANLNSAPDLIATPWDPTDPYANTNYVSVTTIYDAAGQEHTLAVTFRRTNANGIAYEYHALVDSYVGSPAAVNGTEVSAGTLTFTTDGALNVVRTTSVAPVRFEGIAAPQTIAVDFGRSIAEGGSGFDSTISVHGETTVAGEWQDGAACGGQVIEPTPCTWPLPHATTHMIVTANLDARMAEVPVLTAPWSLLWPFTTSNFTILTSVYDSLGESHALGLHFRRTTAGTWDYHAVIDETDAASPSPNATEVGAGKLSFDATGQLLSVDTSVLLQLSFPNATPNQFIALDFGKTTNADGLGHMTELAATSTELPTLQDGRALVGDQARATSICE